LNENGSTTENLASEAPTERLGKGIAVPEKVSRLRQKLGQKAKQEPTVRDRVVQTATLLVLEPIFEADFEECSYGFRRGRSTYAHLQKLGWCFCDD